MTPGEHFIRVQRTARYYTLGEWSEQTTSLWIVIHGYGQLAGDFIKEFDSLADGHTAIAAPEALSRYYPKVREPKVGATWMTREDRLHDIEDYVNYLDQLYTQLVAGLPNLKQIHLLGFSQGTATVTRWIATKQPAFQHLWLCAGDVPPDLDFDGFRSALKGIKLQIMLGTEDPLIKASNLESVKKRLADENVAYDLHTFKGVHEVNVGLLKQLAG